MSSISWWSDSPPWVRVIPDDSLVPASEALPPSGAIFSARMQGREMANIDGVFTQFYEHLRLPDYFGWNWEALRDCLCDLHWVSATQYLLIVDDAEDILHESSEDRVTFLEVMQKSTKFWAEKPSFPEKTGITLRVVLLCAPERYAGLSREVSEAQKEYGS
ncbi:barstar family protein [Streptomyces sp. NBC_00322]|uniref:barstar family protein n=1 Tax=Streptomyces sp. NBC_00322 TaxID=2975712 RepID=UPI002E2B1E35|nr:barstar family protein [Streptomyces sp. NBC_00322]